MSTRKAVVAEVVSVSVWYCVPSARPVEEAEKCLSKWRERGYKIAVFLDEAAYVDPKGLKIGYQCHVTMTESAGYPGYAKAVNALIEFVMRHNPDADWFVCAGDDTDPDPYYTAEAIAQQCSTYFRHLHWREAELHSSHYSTDELDSMATFGVVQPTGDRWLVNGPGTTPGIDLVAGSPWMGREFCRRINQGKGPLWPEYFHMGEDEELQAVATKLGIFWQRPDLTHYHDHWGRPRDGERMGQADRMPEFLKRANSVEEWKRYKKLFAERQAAGFPGSDPL